jgi:Na+/H+ antiporter NhaD/arsenite permease-like protein
VALLGLAATWGVIALQARGRFELGPEAPAAPLPGRGEPVREIPPFDPWQTLKGLGVASFLLVVFLATSWPREIAALAGAGVLLASRKLHSREMLGLVDWQLLVLFIGLFVVNHAFELTGAPQALVTALERAGVDPGAPPWLFALGVLLSNAVSNVPAVMLLLPFAGGPESGPLLALASTLAGNLLLVGSIANLIVVDAAARHGIAIDWHRHARVGVPVTAATLLIAAASLWLRPPGPA